MKKNIVLYGLFLAFLSSIFITPGCVDKEDSKPVITDSLSYQINEFIYWSMHYNYLWTNQVSDLSSTKFKTQAEYDNFMIKPTDHSVFFYSLCYQYRTVDKWSWIVDDYIELENSFQGITKSMGFEFGLGLISNTDNIFGYVIYVIKGGPADKAGLKRGDIFIKINDIQLTKDNYSSLLYDLEAYKIGFATISANSLSPSTRTMNLIAEEVHENPIFLDTVYTVNNKKIGYLVYNGFMSDYDKQLNTIIGDFKTAGIDKLILDLRYNGGGAVSTATYLASMIYGKFTDKVFLKNKYNDYNQSQIESKYLSKNFEDSITLEASGSKIAINSLGLTDVYILTTNYTASASELVINSLKPYMNVITIGTNTHGKYVGSATLYDYIDKNYTINPKHKWALQPIVVKIANVNDVTDYVNGLAPTLEVKEDVANLNVLGNINETMLKTAMNYINGTTLAQSTLKSEAMGLSTFTNSKEMRPHAQEMFIDKLPNLKKTLLK